jgi:FG-GAP-like repeat
MLKPAPRRQLAGIVLEVMLERRRIFASGSRASLWCAGLALACASNAKPESGARSEAGGASKGGGTAVGGVSAMNDGSAGTTPNSRGGSGMTATSSGAANSGVAGAINLGAGSGYTGVGGSGGAAAAGGANDGGRPGIGGAAVGTAGAGMQAGSTGAEWSSAFPTFIKHTIASFDSGYMTVIADIDHDGLPDVVALSSGSAGLVWFKNPTWTKYTVTSKAKQLIYTAPYDVDGDGDLDLAIASDFDMTNTMSGGTVSWAENPGDPTQNQEWTLHAIGAIPTSHRLRWADIDGDGKKELLDLPIFGVGSDPTTHVGAVALTAFMMPADPKGTWTSKVIDNTHLDTAHGIEIVDWDGDKAEDILTAANDGIDLFRPSLGTTYQNIGVGADGQPPTKGSSEVGLGSLGGARFIATIDPWHGTDGVIYTPGADPSSSWTRLDLGSDFVHGHGLMVADFNGDGFDEVVAGGGQGTMAQLIYRYVPSTQTWDKIQLDIGGVAVSGIDVKDINGDGALDIVSIGTSPTNNVVWYENSH